LLSSLEIGIEGVQYDAEGQLAFALERYKAALEKLIPLLRNELKGRRKDLIHQQVSAFLVSMYLLESVRFYFRFRILWQINRTVTDFPSILLSISCDMHILNMHIR
jgi:hypothetical protein